MPRLLVLLVSVLSATAAGGQSAYRPDTAAAPQAPPTAEPAVAPLPQPLRTTPASTAAASTAAGQPTSESLPSLRPPSRKASRDPAAAPTAGPGTVFSTLASLAVVLGLFLLAAWALRRTRPDRVPILSSEVVEVLGRAALGGRQQLHLIRCGNKLLLVCVSPGGIETLTEITDPLEVDRLVGLCGQSRADSATAVFRSVFQQVARGGSERGAKIARGNGVGREET